MLDPRLLPPKAQDRARDWLSLSSAVPAAPRSSAAVLLLRVAQPAGVEVCLMMRHHAMATSGGVAVFPGGMVDAQDDDVPWTAGDTATWAAALKLPADEAARVVNAAVRELFEEVGVLLAGPVGEPGETPPASPADGWRSERSALETHRSTFAELLRERGWGVRADLLRLWSTWTTPTFEARRFRNAFFVACLPVDQTPADGSSESTELLWRAPHELLAEAASGVVQLLPPQLCLALELLDHPDPDAVLALASDLPREEVLPELETVDGALQLLLPEHLLARAAAWGERACTEPDTGGQT